MFFLLPVFRLPCYHEQVKFSCFLLLPVFRLPCYHEQVKYSCFLFFQFSDYHVVVEGFGAKGYKIDRTNEDKLEKILRKAQEDCRNGQSVLVNCLIGKTSFRDGSLSV